MPLSEETYGQVEEHLESVSRKRFEAQALAHIDALWRASLWLTMRWTWAEKLLVATMADAYCSWEGPIEVHSPKVRLFGYLVTAFRRDREWKRRSGEIDPKQFGSEWGDNTPDVPVDGPESITPQQLDALGSISGLSARGAIAGLGAESRFIMVLLCIERFSYSEIAHITGREMGSVRAAIRKLHQLVPRYLVKRDELFKGIEKRPTRVGSGRHNRREADEEDR